MPEYKLVYFNARGAAELTRWIFAYAGIPYEDERIQRDNWPAMKGTVPFGKLPVLMIDGKPLPQSKAMSRYMAKITGLAPKDDLQSAYCDAVVSAVTDVAMDLFKVNMMTDEEAKKKEYAEVCNKTVKPALNDLEKRISDREWICADQLTWADFAVALVLGQIQLKREKFLDEYPSLARHVKKVRSLPKIKEWIDKAPETEF